LKDSRAPSTAACEPVRSGRKQRQQSPRGAAGQPGYPFPMLRRSIRGIPRSRPENADPRSLKTVLGQEHGPNAANGDTQKPHRPRLSLQRAARRREDSIARILAKALESANRADADPLQPMMWQLQSRSRTNANRPSARSTAPSNRGNRRVIREAR